MTRLYSNDGQLCVVSQRVDMHPAKMIGSEPQRHLKPGRTPTFIDLFSGCGGFTFGMLRAGFKCLAAIDWDKNATDTLARNLQEVSHVLQKDLTTFPPAELAKLIGVQIADIIVGGPPCQGFSTARQRDGSNHGGRLKEDARRHLYRCFLDYVEFFQPKIFVIENVLGLRTAAGGRYFTAVQHESRVLGHNKGRPGYRVHSQIEEATKLGVPQKRRRQLIIGVRADLPGYFVTELPVPTRANLGITLGDAICDLPPLGAGRGSNVAEYDFKRRGRFLSGARQNIRRKYIFDVLEAHLSDKLLNHVSRPHSRRDLRDFARLPEGASSAELMREGVRFEYPYDKSTFKDRYTRQKRSGPCSTIVAHLSKDGLMFIHPTQNRSLTPREAARIQSFPDWFVFPNARTHAFRLIGNAVPPLISESLGMAIRSFFGSGRVANPEHTDKPHLHERLESVPSSFTVARDRLEVLMKLSVRDLGLLSKQGFLFGWHALLCLFPELHPNNALDHGRDTLTTLSPAPGFNERFTRSHWPCSLVLIGKEAWHRFDAGELSRQEFYCVDAQRAGLSPALSR